MKYFKYALLSIYSSTMISIIIIFEITAVLLGANVMIGKYNNRNMLQEPYNDILEKNGWFIMCDTDEKDLPVIPDYLKGDIKVIAMSNYYDLSAEYNKPVHIKICPDEIINKMKLSVRSGKWESSSDDRIVCVAAPNSFGYSSGDTVKLSGGAEIFISAVLTDPCYVPDFSSWNTFDGIDNNFYRKYSSIFYDQKTDNESLMLIMSKSEFDKTGFKSVTLDQSVIVYDDSSIAENNEYNSEIIASKGNCGIPLSSLKYRAEMSVKNLIVKYLPIALCMFIVISIGFISCTSINTLKQMKNYGTLFICGMNWKKCITICFAYTAIIMVSAVIFTTLAFSVGKIMNISANLGLSFEMNNIFVSAFIIAMIFVLNMVIPIFIINRRSPIEIIREGSL